MFPKRQSSNDSTVEMGSWGSSPKRKLSLQSRLVGLFLHLPLLAFLLLELVMLTCVWWAYQAPDTLFGTKLELVQQEELFTSMWNYFLSIVTFALVWYNGRWNPLCGGVCLCIWTAFVTFGHESTAKAFDALFYLAKTWTMSPVKPFEFSSGTEVRWSFILKVSLQCAYVVFLFICYRSKRVYFMSQPREAPHNKYDEDSSPTSDIFRELPLGASPWWQRLRHFLIKLVSPKMTEMTPLLVMSPNRSYTSEKEKTFLPFPEMNVRSPKNFRSHFSKGVVVTPSPTSTAPFAPEDDSSAKQAYAALGRKL